MIKNIAEGIVSYLERHNAIEVENRDVYVYGCDIAVYTIASTIGLITIGAGFGYFIETVGLISMFYTNQTMGGGYHAPTHLRCFITMAIGVLAYIATFSYQISIWGSATLGIASLMILLALPLVLHKNKQHLIVKQVKLKRRSQIVTAAEALIFIVILLLGNSKLSQAFAISSLLCAISRCAGKIYRYK